MGKEYAKEIHEANIPLETWLIGHRTEILKSLLTDAPELTVQADSFTVKDE